MRRTVIASFLIALVAMTVSAQAPLKKVYDESINPLKQIDQAVGKAKSEGKFVICQLGGNWCPWCLRFADFITNDTTISQVVEENFVYIHVNYNPRKQEGETAAGEEGAATPEQPWALRFSRLRSARQRRESPAHSGLQFPGRRQKLQPGESTALPQELDARSRCLIA